MYIIILVFNIEHSSEESQRIPIPENKINQH